MKSQALGEILPFPLPLGPTPLRQKPRARETPVAPAQPRTPPIRDWPDSERPRERLSRLGTDALSDAELLALLLRTGLGSGRGSAIDQARALLIAFGGLPGLFRASVQELCKHPGVGPAKACGIAAAFAMAARARHEEGLTPRTPISCSEDVYRRLAARLEGKRAEEFWVLLLDTKNSVLREVQISMGSLSSAQVHPREVFGVAVREGAASLILAHNHPSGDPEPSESDRQLTSRLQESAKILGMRILDHVVIGRGRWESFSDRGWI